MVQEPEKYKTELCEKLAVMLKSGDIEIETNIFDAIAEARLRPIDYGPLMDTVLDHCILWSMAYEKEYEDMMELILRIRGGTTEPHENEMEKAYWRVQKIVEKLQDI